MVSWEMVRAAAPLLLSLSAIVLLEETCTVP